MSKTKKARLLPVVAVSVFGLSVFMLFASFVVKGNLGSVFIAHAESGSGGGDEEDNDNDKEKSEKEKAKEEKKAREEVQKEKEKRAEEEAKRKTDIEREKLKKKTEILRQESIEQGGIDAEDGKEDEKRQKEDEKVVEGDVKEEEKLNEKKADILEDIYEEIFDAEERIEKARLEGVDVTKALATLAEAKTKALLVEQSLSVSDIEAAKRIMKEIKKLAHFARNEDVHDARDIQKDIDKIAKRISQTEGKIFLLDSLGGDTATFNEALNKTKAEFSALKGQIAKGGDEQATALLQLEGLEKKVKSIKSSVENSIFSLGGTDGKFDDDLENETEDFLENLNDVAEIEGDEIGREIRSVALSQKEASKRVAEKVKKADERNRMLQLLFGADDSDMRVISEEVIDNKVRIQALVESANKIEDAEVKSLLLEQVNVLKEETTKLESFVSGQKSRLSALGWFFDLF